eukprot:TRINITY_DN16884_c0_g1_i1.p1 TRINITY_DN16884_c0_g1~~TRINITY_DN16884_c0_g1_i1.p1  ORF type:complete len:605 (+),score=98.54 TRINITY_DN16884_c0_g1_i1:40-1854(+)
MTIETSSNVALDSGWQRSGRRRLKFCVALSLRRLLNAATVLGIAALLPNARADLILEKYERATKSKYMTALDKTTLDEFVGAKRPAPNVMVMMHESSCGICKGALPDMADAAKELSREGLPLAIGHVEKASYPEVKQRFQMPGFPHIRFWRSLSVNKEDEADSGTFNLTALVGQHVEIGEDKAFLKRACNAAGMKADKNEPRLKAVGSTGKVLEVDENDYTAKLALSGNLGQVWFPVEALRREKNGVPLPYRRAWAPVKFEGAWSKDDFKRFARRMLEPIVSTMKSVADLEKDIKDSPYPAFVLCAPEVTRGFMEAATQFQLSARSYRASPAACPVQRKGPLALIYSPAEQQWAAKGGVRQGQAVAAVAVAGPDIVSNDEAMLNWFAAHRFPGMAKIGYTNFPQFVRSSEGSILAAVGISPKYDASNRRVERELLEVLRPVRAEGGFDLYEDEAGAPARRAVGVIDGSSSGLDTFGVDPSRLPRVVVFDSPHRWVEDSEELIFDGLALKLEKELPRMWRYGTDFRGRLNFYLKLLHQSYLFWDNFATSAGLPGRLAFNFVLVGSVGAMLKVFWHLFAVFLGILEDTPDDEASPSKGKNKKKKAQ